MLVSPRVFFCCPWAVPSPQARDSYPQEIVAILESAMFPMALSVAGDNMQAIPLFLFHIEDTDLFAFSAEMSGSNLPIPNEGQQWDFLEEIKTIKVEEYVDPPEFHQA